MEVDFKYVYDADNLTKEQLEEANEEILTVLKPFLLDYYNSKQKQK